MVPSMKDPTLPFATFIRMFEMEMHKNVTITTQSGETALAHSCVLAALSSKLQGLFEGNHFGHYHLETPHIDLITWQIMLEFIYTGSVTIPLSFNVEHLLSTCKALELDLVARCVENYINNHTQPVHRSKYILEDDEIQCIAVKKKETHIGSGVTDKTTTVDLSIYNAGLHCSTTFQASKNRQNDTSDDTKDDKNTINSIHGTKEDMVNGDETQNQNVCATSSGINALPENRETDKSMGFVDSENDLERENDSAIYVTDGSESTKSSDRPVPDVIKIIETILSDDNTEHSNNCTQNETNDQKDVSFPDTMDSLDCTDTRETIFENDMMETVEVRHKSTFPDLSPVKEPKRIPLFEKFKIPFEKTAPPESAVVNSKDTSISNPSDIRNMDCRVVIRPLSMEDVSKKTPELSINKDTEHSNSENPSGDGDSSDDDSSRDRGKIAAKFNLESRKRASYEYIFYAGISSDAESSVSDSDTTFIPSSFRKKKSTNDRNMCTICGKSFSTAHRRKVHTRKYHSCVDRNKVRKTKIGYECSQCHKMLPNASSAYKHTSNCGNLPHFDDIVNLFCKVCNYKCSNSMVALRHYKIQHRDLKGLKCKFCNQGYGDRNRLVKHYKLAHSRN